MIAPAIDGISVSSTKAALAVSNQHDQLAINEYEGIGQPLDHLGQGLVVAMMLRNAETAPAGAIRRASSRGVRTWRNRRAPAESIVFIVP